MNSSHQVLLESWIILDGTCPDITIGDRVRFSLEMYGEIAASPPADPSLDRIGDARYQARGRVLYASGNDVIFDFGRVNVHCDRRRVGEFAVGMHVSGEIAMGVNYRAEFKELSKEPGVPLLIYEWVIDRIFINTAPWLDVGSPAGPRVLIRDESRWATIRVTDASDDDSGSAEYLLECTIGDGLRTRES